MSCIICGSNAIDDANYGPKLILLVKSQKQYVHHHCMFLMDNLKQHVVRRGLLGFLSDDIYAILNKSENYKCVYCTRTRATIRCKDENCDVTFHLKCALQNNCLLQFCGEFKSYCHKHHGITDNHHHKINEKCVICFELIGEYNPITSIPLCCKGWTHVKCLKSYAFAAGYYFKCIICGNTDYRDYIKRRGIFVPDRDAAWEFRAAYSELSRNYFQCGAKDCFCKGGRTVQDKIWYFIPCNVCGCSAVHKPCYNFPNENLIYTCKECTNVKDIEFEKTLPSFNSTNKSTIDDTFVNNFFGKSIIADPLAQSTQSLANLIDLEEPPKKHQPQNNTTELPEIEIFSSPDLTFADNAEEPPQYEFTEIENVELNNERMERYREKVKWLYEEKYPEVKLNVKTLKNDELEEKYKEYMDWHNRNDKLSKIRIDMFLKHDNFARSAYTEPAHSASGEIREIEKNRNGKEKLKESIRKSDVVGISEDIRQRQECFKEEYLVSSFAELEALWAELDKRMENEKKENKVKTKKINE